MKRLTIHGLRTLMVGLSILCAIEGQSKSSTVKGSVLDHAGSAIAAAEVILREQGKYHVFRKTTTDADGKFSFADVPLGEYEIEAKTGWRNGSFQKQFKLSSSKPSQINFVISLEPCSDEPESAKQMQLSNNDRAAIVHETLDLRFNFALRAKTNVPKVVFSDENIQTDWLSSEQKEGIDIMSRFKIRAVTEKSGKFVYYSVSEMTQRGSCVTLSINENWTVKGQFENANMGGGASTYEFKKVNDRWVGTLVYSTIA